MIDLCDIGGRHDLTWAALRQGGTVHVASGRAMRSAEVFAYVADHGITHLAWAPEPRRDVAALPLPGEHDVSRLDTILCEWRSVPAVAVARAQSLFPHVDVLQVYGLADGGPPIACLRSADAGRGPDVAGRLSPGIEIRVVGPDGCPVPELRPRRGPGPRPGAVGPLLGDR